MKMDELELKYIRSLRKARKRCLYPNCEENAISSHLLQKNGVLSKIAVAGKFIEYAPATPYKRDQFSLTGLTKNLMFTFKGFCSEHDNKIFYEIEIERCDFTELRNQILTSYRALSNDVWATGLVNNYFDKLLSDRNFSSESKSYYWKEKVRNLLRFKDLNHFKFLMEKELFVSPKNLTDSIFRFHRFELPNVQIATATAFGPAFYKDLNYKRIDSLDPFLESYVPVSKPVFFNLIPQENSTIFLIGYLKSNDLTNIIPVDKIDQFSENEILRLISQCLIKTETWGMSQAFFEKLKKSGKINQYHQIRDKWLANSIEFSNRIISNNNHIPSNFNLFRIEGCEVLGKR